MALKIDFSSYDNKFDKYESIFNNIALLTINYLKIKADPYISISLVNNEFIHNMNREFRKIDRPTDVISFAYIDNEKDRQAFLFKKHEIILGEIYISIEKANEQAKEYGHSLDHELCFLFIHGLLHLLGYDHLKKEDEDIMFPLQKEIMTLKEKK